MCISGLIFGGDREENEDALDFGDNLPEATGNVTPDAKDIQTSAGYPIQDNRPFGAASLSPEIEATVALVGDLVGV